MTNFAHINASDVELKFFFLRDFLEYFEKPLNICET